MINKEEFHKQYDLFNLSIILGNEIFGIYALDKYKITISMSIKNNIGIIKICSFKDITIDEILNKILAYLNILGVTGTKVGNSIETDTNNIYNLVTIYRMKGILP